MNNIMSLEFMELIVYCDKAIDKLISIDMKGSDKCYKADEPRRSGERQTVTEKEAEREEDVLATNIKGSSNIPVNQSTLENKRKGK